ncbi:hypothetical protein ABEB36_013067 [Hypothenemus hampei]|uniref:RNA methyltransferase n=1 Tax=Hypothenemus hampei TaxID=57062 RepID=A0ABD1E6P1_HYPHA
MDDLNFKCNNPGSVKFGNFINYYQFHPPDERISLLPTNIWDHLLLKDKVDILDVGCNAGDLTKTLDDFFTNQIGLKTLNVLGVDIDPLLIQRAQEKFQNINFRCMDIMSDDWAIGNNSCYDIIFCFSITMWIHLNNGDEGLKTFLKRMCDLSEILVIEPQPWKCYKNALKRYRLGKGDFPKFKELQIRQNVEQEIEVLISNNGFKKLTETSRTKWGRKLLIFRKTL